MYLTPTHSQGEWHFDTMRNEESQSNDLTSFRFEAWFILSCTPVSPCENSRIAPQPIMDQFGSGLIPTKSAIVPKPLEPPGWKVEEAVLKPNLRMQFTNAVTVPLVRLLGDVNLANSSEIGHCAVANNPHNAPGFCFFRVLHRQWAACVDLYSWGRGYPVSIYIIPLWFRVRVLCSSGWLRC